MGATNAQVKSSTKGVLVREGETSQDTHQGALGWHLSCGQWKSMHSQPQLQPTFLPMPHSSAAYITKTKQETAVCAK